MLYLTQKNKRKSVYIWPFHSLSELTDWTVRKCVTQTDSHRREKVKKLLFFCIIFCWAFAET